MYYDKLIEITSDIQLNAKSEEVPLDIFRGNLLVECPEVLNKDMLLLDMTY